MTPQAQMTRLAVELAARGWWYQRCVIEYRLVSRRVLGAELSLTEKQFKNWVHGRVRTRPYPRAAKTLEVMFPPWTVTELLAPPSREPGPVVGVPEPPSVASEKRPSPQGDPVRRRGLLGGLAGLPLAVAAPAGTAGDPGRGQPAAVLVDRLEDLLLPPRLDAPTSNAVEPVSLRQDLAVARADFQASRYRALTRTLPRLLLAADDAAHDGHDGHDGEIRAEVYNLAVHVLIKLEAPGLAWVAADRALTAAGADPVTTASVTRNVATLCRRDGRYDRAQQLALQAADRLTVHGPAPAPEHLSLYGTLLCNAGYAAAQGGDRARSAELLDHADETARRLGGDRNDRWTWFGPTNLTLHRISAAQALGDAGTAIEHAARVPGAALTLPERQSRYWVDVARAYQQWGKAARCYEALTIAERCAPEEVRARPAVRRLTEQLLTAPRSGALPDLRAFAARVGVLTSS
jgi:hypothetical protein